MSAPLNQAKVIIPAYDDSSALAGHETLRMAGSFFFVAEASDEFSMQFDNENEFDVPGSGFKFGKKFSQVEFFNYTENPVTLLVYVGDATAGYDGAQAQKEAPTYSRGQLGLSAADVAGQTVPGYVKTVSIKNGGAGYKVGDVVAVPGGVGTAATVQITSVFFGIAIQGVIQFSGIYTTLPASVVYATGGSGAGIQLSLTYQKPVAGITLNADGTITLANGNSLSASGYDGANRRAQITFRCHSQSPGSLNIFDANGVLYAQIPIGGIETYSGNGNFTIKGDGVHAVRFVIGERFYK